MLNLSHQDLGIKEKMIVRNLSNERADFNQKSWRSFSFLKHIDSQFLKLMLMNLKKHRKNSRGPVQTKDLFIGQCLLLSLLKLNEHQLSSECLSIIVQEFSSISQKSQKDVISWIKHLTTATFFSIKKDISRTIQKNWGRNMKATAKFKVQTIPNYVQEENQSEENNEEKQKSEGNEIEQIEWKREIKIGESEWDRIQVFSRESLSIKNKYKKGLWNRYTKLDSFVNYFSEEHLEMFFAYLNKYRDWFSQFRRNRPSSTKIHLYEDILWISIYKVNKMLSTRLIQQLTMRCSKFYQRFQQIAQLEPSLLLLALNLNCSFTWYSPTPSKQLRFHFNINNVMWQMQNQNKLQTIKHELKITEQTLGDLESMIIDPSQIYLSNKNSHCDFFRSIDKQLMKKMLLYLKRSKSSYLQYRNKNEIITYFSLYEDILFITLLVLNIDFKCESLIKKQLAILQKKSLLTLKERQKFLSFLNTNLLEQAIQEQKQFYFFKTSQKQKQCTGGFLIKNYINYNVWIILKKNNDPINFIEEEPVLSDRQECLLSYVYDLKEKQAQVQRKFSQKQLNLFPKRTEISENDKYSQIPQPQQFSLEQEQQRVQKFNEIQKEGKNIHLDLYENRDNLINSTLTIIENADNNKMRNQFLQYQSCTDEKSGKMIEEITQLSNGVLMQQNQHQMLEIPTQFFTQFFYYVSKEIQVKAEGLLELLQKNAPKIMKKSSTVLNSQTGEIESEIGIKILSEYKNFIKIEDNSNLVTLSQKTNILTQIYLKKKKEEERKQFENNRRMTLLCQLEQSQSGSHSISELLPKKQRQNVFDTLNMMYGKAGELLSLKNGI